MSNMTLRRQVFIRPILFFCMSASIFRSFGSITSFVIIVLRVSVATMIIAVAADKPPTKTIICRKIESEKIAKPNT